MRNSLALIMVTALFGILPGKVGSVSSTVTWNTVVTRTGFPLPGNAGQAFSFPPQQARCVKIEGTQLRPNVPDGNQYRMQFAEVEVLAHNPTGPQASIVNLAPGSSIAASSSFEYIGWTQDDINDGQWDSSPDSMGWSSQGDSKIDHSEWIGLDFGDQYLVQSVVLYP